jgi:hypothetical protein
MGNSGQQSPTWKTFLEYHLKSMVSIDFFTLPTLRFQVLYASNSFRNGRSTAAQHRRVLRSAPRRPACA